MAHTVAIGMDFGTSNSSIAIYDGREIALLPIDPAAGNPNVARSILYVTRDHEVSIGAEAVKLYYSDNIGRPRHFVKKWVGEIEFEGAEMFYVRDIYAYVDEFQPGRLLQYLKTALRTPGYGGTLIFGRFYRIEELVTIYLRMARERASALLEQEIDQVVLGRPVHFAPTPEADALAQSRLLEAAQAAGFRDIAFEMEPIAAALDYASTIDMPENILVFDFGGGTLDITLMRVGGTDQHIYAVGGVDIAGSNFDAAIIREKMLPHFGYGSIYGGKNNFPVPKEMVENISDWMTLPTIATPETKTMLDEIIATSPDACRVNNLRSLIFNEYGFSFYSTVEDTKIRLSEDYAAAIDFRVEDIEVWQMVTRRQFDHILQPYLDSVYKLLINTLADAELETSQIDRVITTGGSSSIPAFNRILKEMFGAEKVLLTSAFTSVTAGLAIKAHKVFG